MKTSEVKELTVSSSHASVPKARDLGAVALHRLAGGGTLKSPDVDSLALSEPVKSEAMSASQNRLPHGLTSPHATGAQENPSAQTLCFGADLPPNQATPLPEHPLTPVIPKPSSGICSLIKTR